VARVGSSGSFVYVQSDQQTIADYGVGDAQSSPLYRYVYASYIDEPVVRKGADTSGKIHYYHRNQQYSITAVTTSAGAIAERYAYRVYGEPTICDSSGSVIASSSINNRYSYSLQFSSVVQLTAYKRGISPEGGKSMPEVSTSGPCEMHLQAWRATHFLRIHVSPSGLRRRRI
jgi:hypothetical protein